MDPIDGRPQWEIHFDEKGGIEEGSSVAEVVAAVKASGVADLVIFSHGWNNDEDSARRLYKAMFPLIGKAAKSHAAELFAGLGYLGVFWPSTWFAEEAKITDEALAVGGGGGDALATGGAPGSAAGFPDFGVWSAEHSGAELVAAVAGAFPEAAQADLKRLGDLIDEGIAAAKEHKPDPKRKTRVTEFADLLRQIATEGAENEEDRGERSVLVFRPNVTAEETYARLSRKMKGGPTGGDQMGIGDSLAKIWHGAKDALRVASFFQMKGRAGTVGVKGLAPLLNALHAAAPEVRVHLVGHSFGGRLVSFSLKGLPDADSSPVHSLTLIQAAFSHWSFAERQPWGNEGVLSGYVDRVKGPLVATFSDHDRAVGVWYPTASVLNEHDNQAAPIINERWGGLGGGGFRKMPKPDAPLELKGTGTDYGLTVGGLRSLNGSKVINRSLSAFSGAHSDIRKPEVAWAVVAAAKVGAGG